jgi:small-conductance mechanosensitive channel
MRFAGMAIAVGFLIQGSYELGFPTYSVLAGLGVGGLAVELAARDSLANLLGSMLIMIVVNDLTNRRRSQPSLDAVSTARSRA